MDSPWHRDRTAIPTRRRSSTPLPLLLSILAAIAVLFSACGGGANRPAGSGIYVPVDGTQTTEGQTSAGQTTQGLTVGTASSLTSGVGVQPTADFEQIEALIQSFLDARADVILGRSDAAALAPVALTPAIDFVVAERSYNQQQIVLERLGSTITEMHTWPNLTAIQQREDELIVTDCTERQEINGYNQFNLWFVEHRYHLAQDAGVWKVAEVAELHNGFLEPSDRFGCAPQSFTERAEATAVAMWTEFVELGRDPRGDAELSSAFSEQLAEQVLEAADAQADAGVVLSSAEEVTFRTLGIDTQADLTRLGDEGTTVAVEICRTFPDGLAATDRTTGEVDQGLPPGAQLVQWLYVQLSTGPEGRTGPDQVVAFETAPGGCGVQR